MYFENYKKINYTADSYTKSVTNILTTVLPVHSYIENVYIFENYTLNQGERPEDVSYKLYDNAGYYWTLLVINNIVDPFFDWYMSDGEVEELTKKEYGDVYATHHIEVIETQNYINPRLEKEILNGETPLPEEMRYVTNLEYESRANEEKKVIRVISPNFITRFVEEYEGEINGF